MTECARVSLFARRRLRHTRGHWATGTECRQEIAVESEKREEEKKKMKHNKHLCPPWNCLLSRLLLLLLLSLLLHSPGVAGINVSSIKLLHWYLRREKRQLAPQTVNEWRVKACYKLRHLINNGEHSLPNSYYGECSPVPILNSFCAKQPHMLFSSNHTLLNLILRIYLYCFFFFPLFYSSFTIRITRPVTDQYLIYPQSKWCSTHPVTSERLHQACNQSLSPALFISCLCMWRSFPTAVHCRQRRQYSHLHRH